MEIEEATTILRNKYGDAIVDKHNPETKIQQHTTNLGLSVEKAKHSIENNVDIGGSELRPVDPGKDELLCDITPEKQWVNFVGRVRELWMPTHENISYVGQVEDQTEAIKFILWDQALDEIEWKTASKSLEHGGVYYFKDVIATKYNDSVELKITRESSIVGLESSFKVPTKTIEGTITAVKNTPISTADCPEEGCQKRLTKVETSSNWECDGHGEPTLIDHSNLQFSIHVKIANSRMSEEVIFPVEHANDLLDSLPNSNVSVNEALDGLSPTDKTKGLDVSELRESLDPLLGVQMVVEIDDRENQTPLVREYSKKTDKASIDDLIVKARELQASTKPSAGT